MKFQGKHTENTSQNRSLQNRGVTVILLTSTSIALINRIKRVTYFLNRF